MKITAGGAAVATDLARLGGLPDARVSDGELSAWFGAEDAPPIRLDRLARGS